MSGGYGGEPGVMEHDAEKLARAVDALVIPELEMSVEHAAERVVRARLSEPDAALVLLMLFEPPQVKITGALHDKGCGCSAAGCRRRKRQQIAVGRGRVDPTLIPHGSEQGYAYWECRCDVCVDAHVTQVIVNRDRKRLNRQAERAAAAGALGRA